MKIVKASRGSGLDLQAAIEDKIAQLNNHDVTSSSNTDVTNRANYLNNLVEAVDSALVEHDIRNVTIDVDDRNLYVTVIDTLEEYQIPFEDLSFDFNKIDEDTRYIVYGIISDNVLLDEATSSKYSPDTVKAIMKGVKNELDTEVDQLSVKAVGNTIKVVAEYDEYSNYWTFDFEELDSMNGRGDVDDDVAYICNTVLTWLDDPEVNIFR